MQALNVLRCWCLPVVHPLGLGARWRGAKCCHGSNCTCCNTTVPCDAMPASLLPRRRSSRGCLVCCYSTSVVRPGARCFFLYILRCQPPLCQLAAQLAAEKAARGAAARGVESAPRTALERASGNPYLQLYSNSACS